MATKYTYYITGDDLDQSARAAFWHAQTFTPTTAHIITSVKLKLWRVGSPGTLTVGIRAVDGTGKPTGGDLCSGTTNGNTLPTEAPYEWRGITLGAGANLSASTKYAIVVRATGGNDSNYANWRADSSSPTYAGGEQFESPNSGSSWSAYGYDSMFEEWGEPIPPQTVSPSAIASAEAFGSPTLTPGGVTVAPTGIASAEAFGTLNLLFDQTVAPSAITSAEAFGTAQLNLTLLLTAIASAEAFGTLTIIPGSVNIAPGGIASAEAFGTPRVARVGYIEPTGIASLEAFGTPQLNLKLEPSGIASAEALGTAKLILYLNPSAIASAEAFGTAKLNLKLEPSGIASAEALGAPTILWELFLLPSAIASAEAFGTPKLGLYLLPSSIASLEAFGSPQLNLKLFITAIASAEAFGTPRLGLYLLPTAIASAEAFGTPTILWQLFLLPTAIASAELFGTPNLYVILAGGDGMKLRPDKGQASIFHE